MTSRPIVADPADALLPVALNAAPGESGAPNPDELGEERGPQPAEVSLDAFERFADDDLEAADPDVPEPVRASQASVPRSVDVVPDIAGARPAGGRTEADSRARAGGRPDRSDRSERPEAPGIEAGANRSTCTSPQLRRFIKSRAYVPMHELRRRFAIIGEDDDVCPIELAVGHIYVGLPPAEGRILGDLVRNGEVGYELSMDPETPIVIGVYAMRPVTRA